MLGVVACVLAVVCKRMQQLSSQRFLSRLRRSWLLPTAEDVSAFGQHRKFPPHARKTSGTQRTCFFVFLCFTMFSLIFLCFPCFPFFPVLLHVFLCFPCFSTFCPGLLCFPTLSLVFLGFPFFLLFLFVFPVSLPSQLFYKILQHSVNFYMILRNIYYKFHTFIKLYIISKNFACFYKTKFTIVHAYLAECLKKCLETHQNFRTGTWQYFWSLRWE